MSSSSSPSSDESDPEVLKAAGTRHFKRKRYKKAADYYKRAAVGADDDPALAATCHTNRAIALCALKDFARAAAAAHEARVIDRSHVKAAFQWVKSLVELEDWAKAAEAVAEVRANCAAAVSANSAFRDVARRAATRTPLGRPLPAAGSEASGAAKKLKNPTNMQVVDFSNSGNIVPGSQDVDCKEVVADVEEALDEKDMKKLKPACARAWAFLKKAEEVASKELGLDSAEKVELQKLPVSWPLRVRLFNLLGKASMIQRNVLVALSCYTTVVVDLQKFGNCFAVGSKSDEEAEAAGDLSENNRLALSTAFNNQGLCAKLLGKFAEAAQAYEKAYFVLTRNDDKVADKTAAQILQNWGMAQLAAGAPEAALPLLERGVQVDARIHGGTAPAAMGLICLGRCLHKVGRTSDAKTALQRAHLLLSGDDEVIAQALPGMANRERLAQLRSQLEADLKACEEKVVEVQE